MLIIQRPIYNIILSHQHSSLLNHHLTKRIPFPHVIHNIPSFSTTSHGRRLLSSSKPFILHPPATCRLSSYSSDTVIGWQFASYNATTSSQKKRKLSSSLRHIQQDSETPIASIEDQDQLSFCSEVARFNDGLLDSQTSLPPHIPVYLQRESSAARQDYIASAASSPSAACAGLSLSDRGGGNGGAEAAGATADVESANKRSLSPHRSFNHRRIMADTNSTLERSSSPMKRRVSDFEDDTPAVIQTDTSAVHDNEHVEAQHDDTIPTIPKGLKSEQSCLIPSVDEQIEAVTSMVTEFSCQPLAAGTTAFIVSQAWIQRVVSRSSTAKVRPEDLDGEIGPIDNSDIVEVFLDVVGGKQFPQLKSDISPSAYQIFSKPTWDYVVGIYGIADGQRPVRRYAHNTNPDGIPNMQFELYPPIYRVHRLSSRLSPIPLSAHLKDQPAPVIVSSRAELYVNLLRTGKQALEIELPAKVRVWKLILDLPAARVPSGGPLKPMLTTAESPIALTVDKLLMPVDTFNALKREEQRELINIDDHSANSKYNGTSLTIDLAGISADMHLVFDEQIPEHSNHYVSNFKASTAGGPTTATSHSMIGPQLPVDSGRSSPALSGIITRGRAARGGRTIGAVGLSNLGNTCYMNSALQCIRNCEELTKYFLSDQAAEDINVDNPMGHGGMVANSYSNLLKQLYKDDGKSSVAPREFKQMIGRLCTAFTGYGQQDSQEFLGFLLDGLQEDLSRVKKKPYIAKPDSTDEMIGDPGAIRKMAEDVWAITKARDDSVIADLFTGMYKSTLVCPICDKVSITFDPFNNLTLQLPVENKWQHQIEFYPLGARPYLVAVELDKHASIKSLKEFVSSRVNIPVDRLFMGENWKDKFYKFYDDMESVADQIGHSDKACMFELPARPTNWPPIKKKARQKSHYHTTAAAEDVLPDWDDPMAERMIIPVLHRLLTSRGSRRYHRVEGVLVPHFIVVTKEEAYNEDVIRRHILDFVAGMTTHAQFKPEDHSDDSDADMVVTTASDVDSGDGKILANSIDGEDDVVDVHMPTDAGSDLLNRKRQKFVESNKPLNEGFCSLFTLSYYSDKDLVPSGWGSVTEDSEHHRLSSRLRKYDHRHDSPASSEDVDNNESSASSIDDDDILDLAPTRMMSEDVNESEDELAAPILPLRSVRGSTHGFSGRVASRTGPITYSKRKFVHVRRSSSDENSSIEDKSPGNASSDDEGPLIRLGEGLVVDWSDVNYAALFEGTSDLDGEATFRKLPLLPDPELIAKRAARDRRRKRGLTLDECFEEYDKEEILSENDTWYCPRCKKHVRASKRFELWRTPDILIIHLKRFSSGGYSRDKLDIDVDYPLEGLDLTKRVVGPSMHKDQIYDLFAVDEHWGGLGGGHYTAHAKSFIDGAWYNYNDSSVNKASESDVKSKSAYLLFYRRRSPKPLGGSHFQAIFDAYDAQQEESESGEGQRLGGDSSLNGSSSALQGVEATHQVAGSRNIAATTVQAGATARGHDPMQMLNARTNSTNNNSVLHDPKTVYGTTWSFPQAQSEKPLDISGATSGAVSVAGSDDVQQASSLASGEAAARMLDFAESEHDAGYVSDDGYLDSTQIPDVDEGLQEHLASLHSGILTVSSQEVHSDSEGEAAEIHLDSDESDLTGEAHA